MFQRFDVQTDVHASCSRAKQPSVDAAATLQARGFHTPQWDALCVGAAPGPPPHREAGEVTHGWQRAACRGCHRAGGVRSAILDPSERTGAHAARAITTAPTALKICTSAPSSSGFSDCPWARVVPLERIWARVCGEAGATVRTNVPLGPSTK